MRSDAGADIAACQRQTIDRWPQVIPPVILEEPAAGDQSLNETMYTAFGAFDRAHNFGKGHAWIVDDLFDNPCDPVHRPVDLWRVNFLPCAHWPAYSPFDTGCFRVANSR